MGGIPTLQAAPLMASVITLVQPSVTCPVAASQERVLSGQAAGMYVLTPWLYRGNEKRLGGSLGDPLWFLQ